MLVLMSMFWSGLVTQLSGSGSIGGSAGALLGRKVIRYRGDELADHPLL